MKRTFKKALCLLAALMLAALAVSCTTAKVTEAFTTDSVDADGVPGEAVASFPCDATAIYAAAKLLNAPDNTQVRVLWTYQTENQVVDEITIDSGEITNRYIYSYLTPTGLVPEGDYKVEFFVEDRSEPDATAIFTVTPSPANIENAIMTASVDADGVPGDMVETFPPDTQMLYTSAILADGSANTQVRVVWTYITGGQTIDEVSISGVDSENRYIYSSLKPTADLPTGDYQVEYYLNGSDEAAVTVPFTITKEETSITDAHMTSHMDAGGVPADTISVVEPTGIWYVSAILRNTEQDTLIRFEWYDTNGALIDAYTFDPQGQSDIYIGGTLQLTAVAPEGTYQVAMFLNDDATPQAVVEFEVKNIASAEDISEYTVYSQAEGGFSIAYPGDWTVIEHTASMAAGFYPPGYDVSGASDDNAVMVVAVKGGAAGYTTESMLQEWVAETETEGLDDYVNIDSAVEDVNGRDMAMFAYSWSFNGRALYTFDFLVIEGGNLYVITSTFRADDVSDLYPNLEQMVLSFDIIQ